MKKELITLIGGILVVLSCCVYLKLKTHVREQKGKENNRLQEIQNYQEQDENFLRYSKQYDQSKEELEKRIRKEAEEVSWRMNINNSTLLSKIDKHIKLTPLEFNHPITLVGEVWKIHSDYVHLICKYKDPDAFLSSVIDPTIHVKLKTNRINSFSEGEECEFSGKIESIDGDGISPTIILQHY